MVQHLVGKKHAMKVEGLPWNKRKEEIEKDKKKLEIFERIKKRSSTQMKSTSDDVEEAAEEDEGGEFEDLEFEQGQEQEPDEEGVWVERQKEEKEEEEEERDEEEEDEASPTALSRNRRHLGQPHSPRAQQ